MLTVAALVLIRRAAAPALSALRDQGTDGVTGRLPFRRWAACSRLTLGVCVAYRLRATVPAPWSRLSASPRPWRSLLHKPRAASPHAKCHAEGCAVLNISGLRPRVSLASATGGLMLADFVLSHRDDIIDRCRGKVALRSSPPPSAAEIDHGVPMFLDELINELQLGLSHNPDISNTATKHGRDLLRQGFTATQVVHDYGDVCQSITEIASETEASIGSDDFRMLNRCLDDAIAAAITAYQSERDASASAKAAHEDNRLRVLGDGLRTSVQAARVAFEVIQSGKVGVNGTTAMVLARSLKGIEDLNERLQVELQLS